MSRLVFCLLLLLSACDEVSALKLTMLGPDKEFASSSEGIHLTDKMANAKDWTRHFKAYYTPMMNCLNAHPAQPAWAVRVVPSDEGDLRIRMQGANARTMECTIAWNGTKPKALEDAFGLDFEQPAFFPLAYGKPKNHSCLLLEKVEKGWFYEDIGWIARHRCTPPWETGETHRIFDLSRKENPVKEEALNGLPEEGVKILAYASARMNTSCAKGECALTTALGLGRQCSERHLAAIAQGFGDFDNGGCRYMPDGTTKLIWLNDLTLEHSAKKGWKLNGTLIRADDRGQIELPFEENYLVGDSGEIILESTTLDDWEKDK